MRNLLKLVAGESATERQVIYECRRCGTTLERRTANCPYCGRTHVARFVI